MTAADLEADGRRRPRGRAAAPEPSKIARPTGPPVRLAPAGDLKKRLTPVQSRVGCLEPHSKPAHAGDHQSFTSDLQSPGCDCDASTRRNLPTARGRKARRLAPENGSLFAVRRVGSGGSRRAQGGRRSDAWRGAAGTQTVPRDVCPSAITAFARWRLGVPVTRSRGIKK